MSFLISGQDCYGVAQDVPPEASQPVLEQSSTASPPLSFEQQQVWLHAQLAPGAPLYNEVLILERRGPLDRGALELSLGEITRRHETLRTAFPATSGTPVQVIVEHQPAELRFTELNALPDEQRKAEVLRIITEEARQPFDLAERPLMRARVLQLSLENYVLVVTLHTIVADEWSLNVLAHELCLLYKGYSAGEPYHFSDLPFQYAEFAYGQRSWLQGDVFEREISYWRERLAGIPPVLELPTDRPRPPVQAFRGARQSVRLSKNLSESLKKLSEREGVALCVTLLAAFQALLFRYTGQSDLIIASIVPGRDMVGTEGMIGLFAHTLVIRTDLSDDPSFRDLLQRVSEAARADNEHQNVPFERLVNELQPERDPSRNPLFQVLFSLAPALALVEPGWQVANLEVDTGAAKVDLQLQLYDGLEGIAGRFTFNTDLFEAATIARMAGHFEVLLQGVLANPNECLSRLPLLTDAERHRLLVEWNNTQTDYPRDRCVHQLFEASADRNPEATAVVWEKQCLTYGELNRRSNQLARHLVKLGVGPEVLVGICVERSLEMVVGLLGILKAGGAYVPLDAAYPHERLSFMLEDAEVPILLTQRRLLEKLPQSGARMVFLDTDWHEIAKEGGENPACAVKPDNLAYVIYTSGSTGKPKGVQIQHRALVNFLSSMTRSPGMTSDDRLLAITTLSFDIAGLEFYLPLSVGASLELVSREVASDGSRLLSKLASSGTTVLQATPATWRMLMEAGWEGSDRLKALCGGEAVSRKLADQLLPNTGSLWNMYGPTETTIWSTISKVEPGKGVPPIGRPIANTQIFILDKVLQPVPVGVPGELHIGGESLARGYLKRPELTAEKFISDPFSQHPQARLYKTGDLARYLPTGDIEFLGRIDHQVKIRGFRIELGEIETALRQHHAVNDTAVVARADATGEQCLVAYFVPIREPVATAGELRSFLKGKLPDYMVPSAFVALKAMPLTPNGKINRRALPAPEQAGLAPKETLAEPRDVLESGLVRIWESVLNLRPIGIRHNFFELGGHSLMAVKLMHRVEQAFGKNLPIATLFEAPTIEQLSLVLRQKGWSPSWSSLVAIQTSGSRPPFFCVHGGAANVLRFRDLARHLGSDQPFYGVQAQGLNGKDPCHTRAQDMASHYIKEIRSVQPEGPYFLGGYSFGGMIALEMAQQLITQGQAPSLVVLFDTLCTATRRAPVSRVLASISGALLKTFRLSGLERRAYVSRIATAPLRAIRRRLDVVRLPRSLKRVRKACLQAAADYVPQPYFGQMILFRSSYRPITRIGDPYAGWSTYAAQGLEIYDIEGNHENILLEPQVRSVAERLKPCLDKAQGKFHSQPGPNSSGCIGDRVAASGTANESRTCERDGTRSLSLGSF